MRRNLFALLIVTLLSPSFSYAAELNAGFVQGLWYAHEPLSAGTPTRIYVALRNNSDQDLTGTVKFTDNGSRIGIAYVSALPGRIVEAWVDWTPIYATHTIAASLTNVQVHAVGESPETGEVSDTLAEEVLFVDYDTDHDGLLNTQDPDDDNDGLSDEKEKADGTDPLTPNPSKTTTDKKSESTSDVTDIATVHNPAPQPNTLTGLEKFVPEGTTHALVTGLTETIEDTRNSLDTYREKRSDDLKEFFEPATTSDHTADGATITRSKIEKDEGFIPSVLKAFKALLSGLYSVFLSAASKLLGHPALLELMILLGMVYMVYRTARRFGRRRNN